MSEVVVYDSPHPAPFIPATSLFHYVFPDAPAVSTTGPHSPSDVALIDGLSGRVASRADVYSTALRLHTTLKQMGVERGDTALLWTPNSIEFAEITYGCVAAGVILSPANIAYTADEIAHQFNDSGASVAFVSPTLLPTFELARTKFNTELPNNRIILVTDPTHGNGLGGTYRSLYDVLAYELTPAERFEDDPLATTWLFYSSGTTGLPKGVMTTHQNLIAQACMNKTCFEPSDGQSDTWLGFLPMSHMYGAFMFMVLALDRGVKLVILPKYDEVQVFESIQKFQVSFAFLVPPIIVSWLSTPNVKSYNLRTLKMALTGAAPISGDLVVEIERKMGFKILEAYGMTETSPCILSYTSRDTRKPPGWCGTLNSTYQARIVKDDGTDAKLLEPGELWVRGPNVMKGYHNNPDANARTFAPGGWLMTGDVLIRDRHGYYRVVDRLKELIKYKGFQVAPAELEGVLLEHKQIVNAGVIGVFDPAQQTELPRAYIVVAPSFAATLITAKDLHKFKKSIAEWVTKRVAPHKRLRGGIVVVDVIPKSPSGKILRKVLRERAGPERAAELEAEQERKKKHKHKAKL